MVQPRGGEIGSGVEPGTTRSGTNLNIMASNHRQGGSKGTGDTGAQRRPPEWADGLKQLYDSVVEEALPDSFKDLLDQLDGLEDGGPSPGSNDNGVSSPRGRGDAK